MATDDGSRPSTSSTGPVPLTAVPARLTGAAAVAPGSSAESVRRPSVQFSSRHSDLGPTGEPRPARPSSRRRMSSPPPPAAFQNRVSFDTFDNKDASDFSLTLNSKHKDYQYTRRSRTFLCGTDQNDYSEFALEWLIDELVDDGDEIVCLRVVDKDSKINSDASVEEGRYRTEAKALLDQIIEKNSHSEEKAISLILEFAVGKVHDTIQRMIQIYEPAILIVGTRGRSLGGIQGLLPGSVSKYCLQHSPVPVIVVRPTYKREKKKKKRMADPNRKDYLNMLERSGISGSHTLDSLHRASPVEEIGPASEHEAEAVAAAVGMGQAVADASTGQSMLANARSNKADAAEADSPSPTEDVLLADPRSPGQAKSPALSNLESPLGSDSDFSNDDLDGAEAFEAMPADMLRAAAAEQDSDGVDASPLRRNK